MATSSARPFGTKFSSCGRRRSCPSGGASAAQAPPASDDSWAARRASRAAAMLRAISGNPRYLRARARGVCDRERSRGRVVGGASGPRAARDSARPRGRVEGARGWRVRTGICVDVVRLAVQRAVLVVVVGARATQPHSRWFEASHPAADDAAAASAALASHRARAAADAAADAAAFRAYCPARPSQRPTCRHATLQRVDAAGAWFSLRSARTRVNR